MIKTVLTFFRRIFLKLNINHSIKSPLPHNQLDYFGAAKLPSKNPLVIKEEFFNAIKNNDLTAVQATIQNGFNLNIVDKDGNTPLILAANSKDENTDMIQFLLRGGADSKIQNKYSNTALMIAAFKGRSKAVEILLKNNASVNIQNRDGHTALMLAVRNNRSEIVESFIRNKAELNMQSINKNETAFSLAKNREMLHLLLDAGANPFVKNNQYLNKDLVDKEIILQFANYRVPWGVFHTASHRNRTLKQIIPESTNLIPDVSQIIDDFIEIDRLAPAIAIIDEFAQTEKLGQVENKEQALQFIKNKYFTQKKDG